MPKTLLLLCASLLLAVPATAACTDKELTNFLTNYDGTLGDKFHIRLTLALEQGHLAGVYFYASQLKDIRLTGKLDSGHLVLDELDASGKATARFEGEFSAGGCDTLAGSWHKIGSSERLPFAVKFDSQTGGTLNHRYDVAGAEDDELIHRNAYRFWEAVKKGDKSTVASLVAYPIKVQVAGAPRTIRNSQELTAQYEAIFTLSYRNRIASAIPHNMFVRDQGIMLGGGEVWFGADGKVKALNN